MMGLMMMSGTKVSVPIFNLIDDQSADVKRNNGRSKWDIELIFGCDSSLISPNACPDVLGCSDVRHKVTNLDEMREIFLLKGCKQATCYLATLGSWHLCNMKWNYLKSKWNYFISNWGAHVCLLVHPKVTNLDKKNERKWPSKGCKLATI